ncbi:hypothetical protein CEXT_510881 [Caerostris extrusa]|uniref:Uncharacterized protein n=1 Tax=Caerostris extrusa TaxID=172846 RepID=A0AAV4XH49_CAEEX|nr:hypothetical protein CEXT_510881 [Caerostris extrusa]
MIRNLKKIKSDQDYTPVEEKASSVEVKTEKTSFILSETDTPSGSEMSKMLTKTSVVEGDSSISETVTKITSSKVISSDISEDKFITTTETEKDEDVFESITTITTTTLIKSDDSEEMISKTSIKDQDTFIKESLQYEEDLQKAKEAELELSRSTTKYETTIVSTSLSEKLDQSLTSKTDEIKESSIVDKVAETQKSPSHDLDEEKRY